MVNLESKSDFLIGRNLKGIIAKQGKMRDEGKD